jgi:hypothetical protein
VNFQARTRVEQDTRPHTVPTACDLPGAGGLRQSRQPCNSAQSRELTRGVRGCPTMSCCQNAFGEGYGALICGGQPSQLHRSPEQALRKGYAILRLLVAHGLYIVALKVEHIGCVVFWTMLAKPRCSIGFSSGGKRRLIKLVNLLAGARRKR